MALAVPLSLVSFEEYLDFEETTFDKHELFRWAQSVFMSGVVAHLASVKIDLPPNELYENVVFDAEPVSPVESPET